MSHFRGSNRHPDARSRSVCRLRENRRTCVRQHPRASHHPIGWHHSRHRKRRACSRPACTPSGRSQVLRSEWRAFRSVVKTRHGYPAKTTSASDANAGQSRLVAADHSPVLEHGWTELLTISLGRHAEFARSSRTITSTTSATNRAGRSGQSLHVCAPFFKDPTVSISHPTERPLETTPNATPLRPLTWAQSRCTSPASRLPVPIGGSAIESAVHEPGSPTVADSGPLAEHQGCGQQATVPRQTGRVSSLSHVLVCAPPVPRCKCTMPCRTSWTLRSTAAGTLRGRSGRVAHARSSQRCRARAVRSAGVSQ